MFKNIQSRKVFAYFFLNIVLTAIFVMCFKFAPEVIEWIGKWLIGALVLNNFVFISFNALEKWMRIYADIKKR